MGLLLLLAAGAVQANTGVPIVAPFVFYPMAALVLGLIIVVEMFMAIRILGVTGLRALAISGTANLVSTVIGLPFTGILLLNEVHAAALFGTFLLVPAFFVSVFSERWVAYCFVGREQRTLVRQWSWRANLRTYEGLLILMLLITLRWRLR